MVYNGSNNTYVGKHIHFVQTDPYTGYIYASEGDTVAPFNVSRILRSTNNGSTWSILKNITGNSMYQQTQIVFTPNYRIFGADSGSQNGIYRTNDDINFEWVLNLTGRISGWAWSMTRDNSNGYIFAGFVTSSTNNVTSTLFYSPDEGTNWYGIYQHDSNLSYRGVNQLTNFDEYGYAYFTDTIFTGYKTFKFKSDSVYNEFYNNNILISSLNENTGTTAYDSSGNANHGTISGATWNRSNENITLVDGVDYTLNTLTGLLTLSTNYVYGYISASWNYYTNIASGGCNQIFNGFDTQFGIFAMAIIGFIGLVGTFFAIRFLISFIKPMISKENNVGID
jgi:hypothetical protein